MKMNTFAIACGLTMSLACAARAGAPLALLGATASTAPTCPTTAAPREQLRAAGFALESRGPGAAPAIAGFGLVLVSVPAARAMGGMVQVGTGNMQLEQVQMAMAPEDGAQVFPSTPWIGECKRSAEPKAPGVVHLAAMLVAAPGRPAGRVQLIVHPLDGRAVVTGQLVLGDRSFAVLATVVPDPARPR